MWFFDKSQRDHPSERQDSSISYSLVLFDCLSKLPWLSLCIMMRGYSEEECFRAEKMRVLACVHKTNDICDPSTPAARLRLSQIVVTTHFIQTLFDLPRH